MFALGIVALVGGTILATGFVLYIRSITRTEKNYSSQSQP